MGVGFNIPNLNIGGGSQFTAYLLDLLNQLGQQRTARATIGSDLFGQILSAQLEANRSPINLVDRLLLAGQTGSALPLSQASEELRGRFTSRPDTNLVGDLARRLEMFSVGALTPTQQVAEGFNPQTGVRLSPAEREYIRLLSRSKGQEPGQFADEPRRMQFGGDLIVDPRRVQSTPNAVAGPAQLIDRSGRSVALMGEAGQPERVSVSGQGEAPGIRVRNDDFRSKLRRDEQFRFDELLRRVPQIDPETAFGIARRPGDFEQFLGLQTDPRAAAARLVGGSVAGDIRFSEPFVRSLALGRAPSPGELTARDFASLAPDVQDALLSVVGPDLARQFLFELSAFTPQGARTRIARAAA